MTFQILSLVIMLLTLNQSVQPSNTQANISTPPSEQVTETSILGATTQADQSDIPIPVPTVTTNPTLAPTQTPTATPTATPRRTPSNTPSATPNPSPTTEPAILPKYTKSPETPSPTPRPTAKALTGPEMDALFTKYAAEYNTDRELLRRIAICESSLNPNARNINYVGLYQFGQAAWVSNRQAMGLSTDLTLRIDPEESIKTAAWMLSQGKSAAWPNCK
jgi:soluble lytic murein transglycosylase-like protein